VTEIRPVEASATEVRVTEIRPAEICVAKVHIAELRLAKERRVEVRPAEIRLAEVWTNGRLISPCVPNLAAFPEEVEMLWVGHCAALPQPQPASRRHHGLARWTAIALRRRGEALTSLTGLRGDEGRSEKREQENGRPDRNDRDERRKQCALVPVVDQGEIPPTFV
jgi:hypothetical protein